MSDRNSAIDSNTTNWYQIIIEFLFKYDPIELQNIHLKKKRKSKSHIQVVISLISMTKTRNSCLLILSLIRMQVGYFSDSNKCKIQVEQLTKRRIDNDLVITGDGTLDRTDVSDDDTQQVNHIIINGTTHVANDLFSDKTWIKQFNLNGNVTFGERCFRRTGITSFVFPLAMTTIPDGSFEGCTSLTLIIFPSNCNRIGNHVFQNISQNIDFNYYGTTRPTSPSSFPNKIKAHQCFY